MAVTMKQIAARTGLSIPTVHQILNGSTLFADATRRKVLAAAAAMKYQPNISARALVTQRSFLVGVLFNGTNFPIITPFMRGVQESIKANHCAPLFFIHNSLEEEADNFHSALERRVDGMIVNAAVAEDGSTNASMFRDINQSGTPVVEVFGGFISGAPSITLDYREAAIAATQRLLAAGHQRIALLNRDRYSKSDRIDARKPFWTATALWQGYQSVMKAAGIKPLVCDYSPAAVHAGNSGPSIGAKLAVPALFEDPTTAPTAVICYSERSAEGLIRHFEELGPEYDRSLTVLIFNKFQSCVPDGVELITMPFSVQEAGRAAGDALFKRIAGTSADNVTLFHGIQAT